MSAYANVQYSGNGSTTIYAVPFSYISKTHVEVRVDGTLKTNGTDYNWSGSSSVQFVAAPANGAAIDIRRNTPKTTRLVDYQDGSVLTEADLDTDSLQGFYLAQEAIDSVDQVISLSTDNTWDAESKKIKNVADPTANQDAATKAYVDTGVLVHVNAAATSASNAATSATNAANSATAAATNATSAATSATNAATEAVNANASATLAGNYATKNDGYASGADNSSKSWAIGGTGNGQPAAGDSKSWATKTAANVDGADFSAKEHAVGDAVTTGSAKNWAQKVGAAVVTGLYSAKEWATGTFLRGAPGGGSAKDWATYIGGVVDNVEYSAKKYAQDAASAVLQHGQCRFNYVSATECKLVPYNGNKLIINGSLRSIPSAGVSFPNTSLAANTTYYAYAYWTGAAIAYELSVTGHATHTDGVEIKSGDATRTLVGMVRTNASSQFSHSQTARYVLSWFNRMPLSLASVLGSDTNVSAAAWVELDTNMRASFICWATEGVTLGCQSSAYTNTVSGTIFLAMGLDGAAGNPMISQGPAISYFVSMAVSGAVLYPTEGSSHYGTVLAGASGGTATYAAGFTRLAGAVMG